jgi:hypothetical protein
MRSGRRRDLEPVPALVALEHLAVALAEHVRLHGLLDGLRDLGGGGPDVAQVDVVALAVDARADLLTRSMSIVPASA